MCILNLCPYLIHISIYVIVSSDNHSDRYFSLIYYWWATGRHHKLLWSHLIHSHFGCLLLHLSLHLHVLRHLHNLVLKRVEIGWVVEMVENNWYVLFNDAFLVDEVCCCIYVNSARGTILEEFFSFFKKVDWK